MAYGMGDMCHEQGYCHIRTDICGALASSSPADVCPVSRIVLSQSGHYSPTVIKLPVECTRVCRRRLLKRSQIRYQVRCGGLGLKYAKAGIVYVAWLDRKEMISLCRIIAKTKDMPHDEWLRLRKKGIGGSDAGTICGLNPYDSPMDVYLDKTGGTIMPKEDNEAMRMGRDLEEYVARRFCEETGFKVRRSNMMYAHEKYPFMIADVDRLVIGQGGTVGLECKTASPYSYEKWKDGKIPAHYLAQCHHYMAVLDAKAWYIAVIIFGVAFKYVRIERDEEVIRNLVQIEKAFWEENVQKQILPEPDGSKATNSFLNSYFGTCREKKAVPLSGFDEKLERREELGEAIEELTVEKRKIEQELKIFLSEAEFAENEKYRVSWTQYKTRRVDAKRLREEMPDVYEEYAQESINRRFTVKAA